MLPIRRIVASASPLPSVDLEKHFSFYSVTDSDTFTSHLSLPTNGPRPMFADLSPQSISQLQKRERFVGLEPMNDVGQVGATYGAAVGITVGAMLAPATLGLSVLVGSLAAPVAGYLLAHAVHLQAVHEVRPEQLDADDFCTTGVVDSDEMSRRLCRLLQEHGILDDQLALRNPNLIGNYLDACAPEDFELQAVEFDALKTFFALFLKGLQSS